MRKLVYSLFVEGDPKAQPRPRRGKYGNFYNPPTADIWKQTIQVAFLSDLKPMIENPVSLKVHFFFHRATGLGGKTPPHTGKPDIDNLLKPVMDALTAIGVWRDDCLVKHAEAEKFWTLEKSGAHIWIETEE